MNKLVTLVILIAWLMGLVVPVPVSAAAIGTAGNVTKSKFQGDSAFASFSSTDPTDPCIQTSAFVSATEGRLKEGQGKPELVSEVFVSIFQFNTCTGEVFLDAFGSAQLSPEAFAVEGQLDAATLTATVEVCDFITGGCFPVDVQLTWSATGPVVKDKSKFQSTSPGCKFKFDFMGNFRDAVATGTITGGGFSFSGASDFAQIASVKQGSMEIGCES
jgi:hypothetical protein